MRRTWVFMRGIAPIGAVLALLVATAIASAAAPVPSVSIAWPPPGAATNADMLAVDVRFAATGNVHTVVLELDGREAGRRANPPQSKNGSYSFTVPLGGAGEGSHQLQAFAYQGDERAGLQGASATVPVLLDRTPPQLELDVANGTFFTEPRLIVHGSVSDALSGVASLTCDGTPIPITESFECVVVLAEGINVLRVRAVDRAGNVAERQVTVDHFPGGVAGLPGASALSAVDDVLAADANTRPEEVGVDAAGRRISRTKVELGFSATATVAELNGLLRSVSGRIVSSLPNTSVFAVRIADPGTVAAVEALESRLEAEQFVDFVNLVGFQEPGLLPDTVDRTDAAHIATIDHHLAVRGPAAWNAAALLDAATTPTLVLGDYFGEGAPDVFFDVTVSRPADFATGNPDPNAHGYHVLGIATAAFDGVGGTFARDIATGIFPGTLPLRVVDYQSGLDNEAFDRALIDAIRATSGKVVLNTSVHSACRTPAEVALNCTQAAAHDLALAWEAKVRGVKLEDRFLHVTIAGNVHVAGDTAASTASSFAASRLLPLTRAGATVLNVSNVLVVENQQASGDPPRPHCLAADSKRGGDLSAIGTNVWSLTAANAGEASGTSQAAPQAAGVAAYLWSAEPTLTPQQLAGRLRDTARPGSAGSGAGCAGAAPAPSLDAYAALLTADTTDPGLAVRLALLNANSDTDFDENDLAAFTAAFDTAAGALDYGRHDLNGDGRTGGPERDRFDLDVDDDTVPNKWSDDQEQTIETLPISYEDARLTDLDVLCYYAHTSLYTGDPAARDAFAAESCLEVTLETTFPATVVPDTDTTLEVRARRPNGLLQPGVHLELAATGGSVADSAGFTDTSGVFRTSGRLLPGAPELRIEIVARAGAGGAELARETFIAGAAGPIVPIGVTIAPTSGTVGPGETVRFTATVEGSSNGVTWSSSAGSITDTGLLSPPLVDTPLTLTVTARSRDDLSKSASASIEVIPQSAWIGRWEGTVTSLVFGEMRTVPTVVVITKTDPLKRVSNLELGTRSGRFIMLPGFALLPDGVTRLPDSTTAASSKIHGFGASDVCRVDATRLGDALLLTIVPLFLGPICRETYSLVRAPG